MILATAAFVAAAYFSSPSNMATKSTAAASEQKEELPLQLGGQYSVGDPQIDIPDGMCLSVENHLTRPGRLPARPPFVYDSLMNVTGIGNYDDLTNRFQRLLAFDTNPRLFMKGQGVETWSSSLGAIPAGRISSVANYLGKAWITTQDSSDVPSGAFSFDGTNISSTPFNSVIAARAIQPFVERLFAIYPRVTVTPLILPTSTLIGTVYDWTGGEWLKSHTIAGVQTVSSGAYVGSVVPTSLNPNDCMVIGYGTGGANIGFSIPASAVDQKITWVGNFRATHATYDVPITMSFSFNTAVQVLTAYNVGDVVSYGGGVGSVYRCIVAGTTTTPQPAYTDNVGAVQTDGTAQFVCLGRRMLSSYESYVFSLSTSQTWQPNSVTATIPAHTNTVYIYPELDLYNSTTPALTTLAAIQISYRDGKADGDKSKHNYGQQFTLGDFQYPFINTETATTAAIDLNQIIWSEIRDPQSIRGANYYNPNELVGYPTAITSNLDRLIVFYRNGFIQFQSQADPDFPIRRESVNSDVGCLGPRAHDTFQNVTYFIAQNGIYSYTPGSSAAFTPQSESEICGDAMKERIMDKGAGWVESQSTYKRPLLKIDRTALILWVYTQKGYLFAYDLKTKQWSTHYVNVSGVNAEIDDMEWNPSTGNFYVAFGGKGLARLSLTATAANDTIDNTATTYPGTMAITLRPITKYNGGVRQDIALERATFHYATTISQSGGGNQTVAISDSLDQQATVPAGATVTCVVPASASATNFLPLSIDLPGAGPGPSHTLRIVRTGKLGETAWSLSPHANAKIKPVRDEEYRRVNPTSMVVT